MTAFNGYLITKLFFYLRLSVFICGQKIYLLFFACFADKQYLQSILFNSNATITVLGIPQMNADKRRFITETTSKISHKKRFEMTAFNGYLISKLFFIRAYLCSSNVHWQKLLSQQLFDPQFLWSAKHAKNAKIYCKSWPVISTLKKLEPHNQDLSQKRFEMTTSTVTL